MRFSFFDQVHNDSGGKDRRIINIFLSLDHCFSSFFNLAFCMLIQVIQFWNGL